MRLIDDKGRIASRSISWWMGWFGIALLIGPEVYFKITGHDYNPYFVWWLALFLLFAAQVGRMIHQPLPLWREWLRIIAIATLAMLAAWIATDEVRAAPATEQQTLDIAVPLTGSEEGLRLAAYKPFKWDKWTICYGETDGVHEGMTATKMQCDAMLRADLARRRIALHRYYRPQVIADLLPATRDAAYLDTAYNCGVAAIGKSTATRRLNAGDVAGGCHALTWWKRGGGRVLRGLFRRRKRDEAYCMIGIDG